LARLKETRDTHKRIDAVNAEIDLMIKAGRPTFEIARLEACRNRIAVPIRKGNS